MARLTELWLHAAPSVARCATISGHHLAGKPSNNRHTAANFAERFWRKVDVRGPQDCWLWKGGTNSAGRGQVYLRTIGPTTGTTHVRSYASGVAWELTHGAIPDGLKVCHNCPTGDNPRCVNPNHLFLGTQKENIQDSIRKGRFLAHHETGVRLDGQPSERRRRGGR